MGEAAAITTPDFSATLPPRVQDGIFASCVRAHVGTVLIMVWDVFFFRHFVAW